jgi:DNA repair protein SbcD/Mre11
MASFKFVHAADIHLDSPLRGLQHYDGAPVDQLRGCTRQAFIKLIDLCIAEQVAFLILAGDLYDGDWKDYNTGLFFAQQMRRLKAADIRVISLRGNHDAASQISRNLKLPENVQELSWKKPATIHFSEIDVAIHGQGFASKAIHDNLAAQYPGAIPDKLNIGVLHTSLGGREGHEPYAPCAVDDLLSKGYDYWALGHVHQREVVHADPWIVFPGNLQGRHIRETGCKGATLVMVVDKAITSVDHRSLDVVRWSHCKVSIDKLKTEDEMLDAVQAALALEVKNAGGRLLASRVTIHGRSPLHRLLSTQSEHWANQIRAQAIDLGGAQIWLEKIRFESQANLPMDELRERDDPLGALLRSLHDLRQDPTKAKELAADCFSDLLKKIPKELQDGPDGLGLDNEESLIALLFDIEQFLIPQLLGDDWR